MVNDAATPFGASVDDLAAEVAPCALAKGLTVSAAESLTGGTVVSALAPLR